MSETASTMLPLGTPLPAFRLTDAVTGKTVDSTESSRGKAGVLVAFVCNHCPYVIHIRKKWVEVAHGALDRGLSVLAVNSNDEGSHPQDGPAEMRRLAREEGWRFPFLFDKTQEVAKSFRAACTPELYLFDGRGRLVYRGQFDDTRPSSGRPATGASLLAAIEAVMTGAAPPGDQRPSIGCNIKWRSGNEPPWFA